MAAAALAQGGNGDPKGRLMHVAQRVTQRPIAKDDIVYTNAKYGDVYQATVTLNCMEGQQFVGETDVKPKEAEKKAATQALIHLEPTLASLPPTKNQAKRKAAGGGEPPAKAAKTKDPDAPPPTFKTMLNTLCMQLMKRPLPKTDIIYETNQTPVGYQSTVKMPFLPGEWGQLEWNGEPSPKQKEAGQNAAKQAVEALQAQLEAIKALLPQTQTPQKAPKPNAGTKSKGGVKAKGGAVMDLIPVGAFKPAGSLKAKGWGK